MSIFDIDGREIVKAYSLTAPIYKAYSLDGTKVFDDSSELEPMDWTGMAANFKTNIDNAAQMIQTELANSPNAFAFPVYTDVHTYFAWNEPNYVAYHWPTLFSEFLFLGDMTNVYDETQLNNAVTYMNGARNQNMIVSMGNHEFGGFVVGTDELPRDWYKPLCPASCVFYDDDGLTYYWDDEVNNVRFIMMDSNSTVKKQSGVQRFDLGALSWMAGAMESAGSKSIIVMNHAIGSSFYLVTDTDKTDPKSGTTITNMPTFNNIVTAFKAKTSITVTAGGVASTYDFSNNTGYFIAYITGHYHNAGFTDSPGYNKFTCPALIRNKQAGRGMSFFVIDQVAKTIQFIVSRIYSNDQNEVYTYSYEVTS